jgi:hypothetical protein
MDCIENDMSNNSSIVFCVFVAAVTFLQSCCLATIGEYIYRHRDWWEGFMKYTIEMGSVAMIYIRSFIKIGSGIQKLLGGDAQTCTHHTRTHAHTHTHTHTHTEHGDFISLLLFFENK